jgi:ketosteroid isomerase-like protein
MNRNLETVQSIYQAFGRHDIPAILATLSPQVRWEAWSDLSAQRAGHPLLVPRTDPAGVGRFFQAIGETVTLHEFQLQDVFGSGRQVAAEVMVDCTYRATGQRIRDEEIHLWTFDDTGKVERYRHYLDTAKHLRAAGLATV